MTYQMNDSAWREAIEGVLENGLEGMGKVVEVLLNEAMKVERSRCLQANPYERTKERKGYANGYKGKTMESRLGSLKVQIPQVREGDFYPSVLEKGCRSERALKLAVAEMYIAGVSTRRVEKVMKELCGYEISSTEVSRANELLEEPLKTWRERPLGNYPYLFLDAKYAKVRQAGHVVDLAILIAVGVNEEGKREVLGISARWSEKEVHWREFLQGVQKRGLSGVTLIISDAHSGLKAAKQTVFPSVPWQRCQFHLQQNAQAYVTKLSKRGTVASDIRGILNAPNRLEAERL